MGNYHNKLDKKYFNKSIYMKKFEDVFNVKIKDCPIQYEIILDTFNTFISFNNILFSASYMKNSDKLKNSIHLLSGYLNKYKSKIKKCYDLTCIWLYDDMENMLDELKEIDKLNAKINLEPIKKSVEEYTSILEELNFDMLYDIKKMPYLKLPNDKLPKKVNCKIINNLDIVKCLLFSYEEQKKINDEFIKDYFQKTNIDLNTNEELRNIIFEIHTIIKDINNAIVEKMISNDNTTFLIHLEVFNIFVNSDINYLNDIYYQNLFYKVKDIVNLLNINNIDLAYEKTKDIVKQYKKIYERNS